ncbi:hypothetical protein NQZ68_010174 [Dissostichus eleginoides]|nr:hypothetical protein NQZ68_010174 [Dissostichus eleginoides]
MSIIRSELCPVARGEHAHWTFKRHTGAVLRSLPLPQNHEAPVLTGPITAPQASLSPALLAHNRQTKQLASPLRLQHSPVKTHSLEPGRSFYPSFKAFLLLNLTKDYRPYGNSAIRSLF